MRHWVPQLTFEGDNTTTSNGRLETEINGRAGDDIIKVTDNYAGSTSNSNGNQYGIAKVTIDGGEGDPYAV